MYRIRYSAWISTCYPTTTQRSLATVFSCLQYILVRICRHWHIGVERRRMSRLERGLSINYHALDGTAMPPGAYPPHAGLGPRTNADRLQAREFSTLIKEGLVVDLRNCFVDRSKSILRVEDTSMPRRARIHFVSLHSSLVNLPISIYGPLLERGIVS